MSLESMLRRHGGVAPWRVLADQGITRHHLDLALDAGTVIRPRRGWIALPNADEGRLFAVRSGTVLSCVTQARRLGLWVSEREARPHVAASARTDARDCVVHWGGPVVARPPGTLEDCVDNVLHYVAQCQPYEAAAATWESALRRGLVDRDALRRLPFRGAARRLVEECEPFADSGLETIVRRRLAWLNLPVTPQAWILGHRVDFLVGERLILQIDGGHHVGAQRTSDIAHDAELMLRGYTVIRVSYEQVMHRWPEVQRLIMAAIAQGLHLAR